MDHGDFQFQHLIFTESYHNRILNDDISSVHTDQYYNFKYDPMIDMTDYL